MRILAKFALSILIASFTSTSNSQARRDQKDDEGLLRSDLRVNGASRSFVINDTAAAVNADTLSRPDTVYKTSNIARFVDDNNEGPETSPPSAFPIAIVMENGSVYLIQNGVVVRDGGSIVDFKKKYFYVAHDFYRWNPTAPENYVNAVISGTHTCSFNSTDNDNMERWLPSHCTSPRHVQLTTVEQLSQSMASFQSTNTAFNQHYRRSFTIDGTRQLSSGQGPYNVHWGFHWVARVGCRGITTGSCANYTARYDTAAEHGVAAAVGFSIFPEVTVGGVPLRSGLTPPFEGALGSGRNLDVLASQFAVGTGATISGSHTISPGGKVEILAIDMGDRVRLGLVLGRYENDPLTSTGFFINRFNATNPYGFAASIDALARNYFDRLLNRQTMVYLAPTIGAIMTTDALDLTPPYSYGAVGLASGIGGSPSLIFTGDSHTYAFGEPPIPRYILEDLRLKEGQSE